MALAGVRGEELQHGRVVGVAVAGEGVADDAGQVQVAGGDGVGVAVAALEGLGGGPRADAGDGLQPSCGLGQVHGRRLLQAVRDAYGPDDGVGAFGVDPGLVPVPGRDQRPGAGVGHDVEVLPVGAGGGLAVLPYEAAPGAVGLVGGDLLLQDRGDQGLQHQAGAGQAQARTTAVAGVHEAVAGDEDRRVVAGAEQRGQLVEQPCCAGAPGLGVDLGAGRSGAGDAQGGGPFGGPGGAPDGAVGCGAESGVAGAAAQRAEGEAEVDGAVGDPAALPGPAARTACAPRRHVGAPAAHGGPVEGVEAAGHVPSLSAPRCRHRWHRPGGRRREGPGPAEHLAAVPELRRGRRPPGPARPRLPGRGRVGRAGPA
ncbi:hypothetical protein ADK96_14965 [Streptomyces sp. IGB124]|nr:hypothetical protein ADK96_14965 [Streptomyces sp. IGB124]